MNKKIAEGQWKEFKGKLKEKWGKLTDNDLEETEGHTEQIAGKIQKRYGHSLEDSHKMLNESLDSFNKKYS